MQMDLDRPPWFKRRKQGGNVDETLTFLNTEILA